MLDENLTNFLTAAHRVYRPIMLQVELIRTGGAQTAPPDERLYFTAAYWAAREEPYKPPTSDFENDLYLMKFGKRKAKA